jgi:hypothetical protein
MIAEKSTARGRDRAGMRLNLGSGAVSWGAQKRARLATTPVGPRESGIEDMTPRPSVPSLKARESTRA